MKNCLYFVTSEEYSKKPTIDIAKEAIASGVDILQMREKNKSEKEQLKLGVKLRKLCKNIPFIVNDDPYLAKKLKADGIHLGQDDFKKYSNPRKIIGDKIIGLSTHSLKEVKQANTLDINYIAFGPIFPTKTKDYFLGTGNVKQVLKIVNKPVVFIGGINENNINELSSLGAKNVAVIRAISSSDDIRSTVKKLKSKLVNEIRITLNGKVQLTKAKTLPALIKEKKINAEYAIVEYNQEVIKSEQWAEIALKNNDNIEIVSFFAGG